MNSIKEIQRTANLIASVENMNDMRVIDDAIDELAVARAKLEAVAALVDDWRADGWSAPYAQTWRCADELDAILSSSGKEEDHAGIQD